MRNNLLSRALMGLAACAVAFFVILGVMAVLPRPLQDALPDNVLGGAAVVLAVAAARRFARRAR
ncbi:hypothetical protein [Streptomyces sp. NRRL F-2664]|uniref:hypothetical protein n=1 Tax=Streptomyces sp. NRRL F-2664 TaxID=1463842 RepID=UPI0004C94F07|nr:hypothetical protein [Streptomyces sp. NRRL F-2664]